jgi:hypothetical protein
MDDFALPSASTPPPPELAAPAGPGRKPLSPEQRMMNDKKYQQMVELWDNLPITVREPKFVIFEANRRSDTKASFKPLGKITASEWKDQTFNDQSALASYLESEFGPDRYYIEAQDEHGQRIGRIPSWCIETNAYNEDDMDDEFEDDDRHSRRSRRRRDDRDDDLDDDDRIERRSTLADSLATQARVSATSAQSAMSQQKDLTTLMMMTQQQNADRQATEERSRRDEERRREERRDDDRRREEKNKEDDRIRREDEKRREDQKREDFRREDDKRRDDERREADRKHERDLQAARDASNKRLEVMVGALPAIIPLIEKVLRPAAPALPPTDPLSAVLAKEFITGRNNQDPNAGMSILIEACKAGQQINSEQMKNAIAMSGEVNKIVLTKALDMLKDTGGSEGKEGLIEKIHGIVSGASDLAKIFVNQTPVANPYAEQAAKSLEMQRRAAAARQQQQSAPQQPAPAQPTPAQPEQPTQPAAEQPGQPTPEQQAAMDAEFERRVRENPIYGTMRGLFGIQQRLWQDQAQYQQMVQYTIQWMPLALRVAVLDGNEDQLFQLCMPVIKTDASLVAWVQQAGVLEWLRSWVPTLKPSIEHMFGPADKQREEYVAEIQKAHIAAEQAAAPQQPAPLVADEVVPAPAAPAPAAPAEVPQPQPQVADPIQGPGSQVLEAAPMPSTDAAPVVQEGAKAGPSHLDSPHLDV